MLVELSNVRLGMLYSSCNNKPCHLVITFLSKWSQNLICVKLTSVFYQFLRKTFKFIDPPTLTLRWNSFWESEKGFRKKSVTQKSQTLESDVCLTESDIWRKRRRGRSVNHKWTISSYRKKTETVFSITETSARETALTL